MKKIIILIFLIIGISIGILSTRYYFLSRYDFQSSSEPQIEYKTIRVEVPNPYPVPKPYPVDSPPKIIKKFITDSSLLDSLKLVIENQNIVITGLSDSLSIHQNYLKQFPSNPKLIELLLSKDSLSLALLNIQGQIYQNTYPIFLNHYRYKYTNSGLTSIKIKPIVEEDLPESHWLTIYSGMYYCILQNNFYPYIRMEKDIKNFKLNTNINLNLNDYTNSQLLIGIGYKLY